MFKSRDVSVFLQQFKLTADGDDVVAHGTFYITPIKYGLANEIDGHLADRLFRKKGADYVPCAEIPSIDFDIAVDPQSMSYSIHKDIPTGRGMVPHVAITKLRAFKLFNDDPNFTLAFDCAFPADDKDMLWFMLHRMKKPLLVTFKPLQGSLEFPKAAALCEICNEPATHRTSPGKSLVCAKHIGAYTGEEVEPLDPDYEEKTIETVQKTIQAAKKKAARKKANGKTK